MNRLLKVICAMCFILCSFSVVFQFEVSAENNEIPEYAEVIRIYGATRYETSLAIANELKETLRIDKFDTVILTSGEGFADALAGSYLAAKKDAPILMVNPKKSNVSTIKSYLDKNMNPSGQIYILGGTSAVPSFVERELKGYNIKRLSGNTRYETNLVILNEAGVSDEPVLVCYGEKFADSLSASATGFPLLLVNKTLNAKQKDFLEKYAGKKIYVLGGTAAVSEKLEKELMNYGSVKRISGNTRYETSLAIAKEFFVNADRAVLAYGENYPDGLCGGPLAYHLDAPMILTSTSKSNTAASYTTSKGITSGAVLGGSKLISDEAVKRIFGSLPKTGMSLKPVNVEISISLIQVAQLENCVIAGDAEATANEIIRFIMNNLKFTASPIVEIVEGDEVVGTILDTGNYSAGTFSSDTVFTITISGGPK